jgi:hypothetical protein
MRTDKLLRIEDLIQLASWSRDDDQRVLSIYMELPGDARHERRRWLSTLNSGLRQLQAQHPGDRHLSRLAELADGEIRSLSPETRGRSLAYIAGESGRQWLHSSQLSTGTGFVWHARPVLRPLVGIAATPTTGAVVVAQDKARLLTWRQGLLEEDKTLVADLDTTDWRRFAAGAMPTTAQQTVSHADDFQARFDEQVDRFVRSLAAQVGAHAREERWELALIATAGPRLGEVLEGALPAIWRERLLPAGGINLIRAGLSDLADHITAGVETWLQRRALAEVERILGAANSRGGGTSAALGPAASLDLLAQHRVAELLFAADFEMTGYRRADGFYNVYPAPGHAPGPGEADAHLVEWMIAECLASGATATRVSGEAARLLLEQAGGVAVSLRY